MLSHKNLINHPYKPAIIDIFKNYTSFYDKITENEFKNLYFPKTLKDNFLPIMLGKIFLEYRIKEFLAFQNILLKNRDKIVGELEEESEKEFRNRYGGYTPWELLNDFLSTFDNFDYVITNPKKITMNEYHNQPDSGFLPKLKKLNESLSINYSELSSGEQILFSLALSMFKMQSKDFFPKVLLLDEIDATLHPSMIKNLLDVIQQILVKKSTKVILVTHSPTTIALATDRAIFVVNKNNRNRIEKSNRKSALNILTQGYATLEEGLKLFDQIGRKEISIITEGENTIYIKKAAEFFAGSNKDRIDVFEGIEGKTGKRQLKTVYDLFVSIPHNNKILCVWDFDADEYKSLPIKNKTYGYVFTKNESNKVMEKGIENLFDEELFQSFTKTTKDDATGESITKFNSKDHKKNFLHRILLEDKTKFQKFKHLFEYIDEILNSK